MRQVAVLGLVFCAVAFALAVPLRTYLAQRQALAASISHEQDLRAQLAGLHLQKQALSDPAYIAAELKKRFQYVKPGDTVYVVHAPELPKPKPAGRPAATPTVPWYSPLWDTLSDPVVTAPSQKKAGN